MRSSKISTSTGGIMGMVMMPERPSDIIQYLRLLPLEPGEWLALVQRQKRELTYREAALQLDVSVNRIYRLTNPNCGALRRTRRGFVATKSLLDYVAAQSEMPEVE